MDDLKREVDRIFSKVAERFYQLVGRPVARALARTGIRFLKIPKMALNHQSKQFKKMVQLKNLKVQTH